MADLVLAERDGAIAVVLLNRPDRLNALSDELMDELATTLEELDRDQSVRAIVLGGSERAFAAGADIGELAESSAIDLYYQRRVERWDLIRSPLDAADRRRVGLLPRRRLRARDVVRPDRRLRERGVRPARDRPRDHPGRRRDPAPDQSRRQGARDGHDPERPQALRPRGARAGLVARVVAKEAWLEEAKRLARDIAEKGPVATRLAKESVDRAYETTLSAGLEAERRALYLSFASEDAKEGLTAFTEKRKPSFEGR